MTATSSSTSRCGGRAQHGVATEMPRAVKREAEALKVEGCPDARISSFDREAGVWAITFTRGGERKALLMWTVEVDI